MYKFDRKKKCNFSDHKQFADALLEGKLVYYSDKDGDEYEFAFNDVAFVRRHKDYGSSHIHPLKDLTTSELEGMYYKEEVTLTQLLKEHPRMCKVKYINDTVHYYIVNSTFYGVNGSLYISTDRSAHINSEIIESLEIVSNDTLESLKD